jgi:hypothetical protein
MSSVHLRVFVDVYFLLFDSDYYLFILQLFSQ